MKNKRILGVIAAVAGLLLTASPANADRYDEPLGDPQGPSETCYVQLSNSGHHVDVISPNVTKLTVTTSAGSSVYLAPFDGVRPKGPESKEIISVDVECDEPPATTTTTTVPVQIEETTTTTTTTVAAPAFDEIVTTTTAPPVEQTEVAASPPAQPIVGQPTFTG